MKAVGIILIVLGISMTFFTKRNIITPKKVVDFGSVEISTQERTPIYWLPIAGGLIVITGVVVIFLTNRRAH